MLLERVILIGLSGSGKSAVAPLVAERFGFAAVDTDAAVETRLGMPVPEVFARLGETVFRAVEREVLAEACGRSGVVLATGGGAVLDEANWGAMRPGSVIVYLSGRTDELARRVAAASDLPGARARPLLAGDAVARLARLREERGGLYARADAEVDTTGMSPPQVAETAPGQRGARQAARP